MQRTDKEGAQPAERIWQDIVAVRSVSPLVHSITNYVVMNNTANAVLAAGASPIMAHAVPEVGDMVALCAATVINIGTLDPLWVEAMKVALRRADALGRPVVLDPVGAGATPYRNQVLGELLAVASPAFIRGNAGEIMTLAGIQVASKGVDSAVSSADSDGAARALSLRTGSVVSVSGPTDVITDGRRIGYVGNGHPMMTRVTGLGCTASALLGAFAAVQPDRFAAAVSAAAFLGVCGELAAAQSAGPGSLQMNLYDVMYNLEEADFARTARVRIE